MSPARAVALIILAGTLVRLVLAASVGLGVDEAYMVGNARELALSYFDHPPLHVWMTWAAMHLFGSEAPVVVRLPFILLFAGSTWLMYDLTARLFGGRAGVWAAALLNLAPIFTLADASWVLPDGPVIFFLLASADVLCRLLFADTPVRRPLLHWLAAGALGGLALLSKYNAVFFFAAVVVFLLTVPDKRRWLATAGPWLGVIVALAVFSPAIIWNLQHGLVGFGFQAKRAVAGSVSFTRLATSIGGQLGYLAPWVAVPLAIALGKALARGPRDQRSWLLALAAIGPIVVFTVLTLFAPGLPHWSMPGWLFTFALFGRDASDWVMRSARAARGFLWASAAALAIVLVAVTVQATRGGLIPSDLIADKPALDPTIAIIDWTALPEALKARGLLTPDLVVAAPDWINAGKASYALGPGVPVVCVCSDPRQFTFRMDQQAFAGRDAVVVIPASQSGLWPRAGRYFDRLDDMPGVPITRAGTRVETLQLKTGRNLHFPADTNP